MKRTRKGLLLFLLGVMVAAISFGCSSENPLGPPSGTMNSYSPLSQDIVTTTGDPFQVTGRVESIDWDALQLTLAGYAYVITAGEDCDIALIEQGIETPIAFAEMNVGDSLQVCGTLLENDNVLARRIRVYSEGTCDPYDVAFGGTIATIDYAAGTFTVAERGETILTDENTVIWTRIYHTSNSLARTGDPGTTDPDHGHFKFARDTILAFVDLKVGDWIEVKADIIDVNTLLAVKIKLASDCLVQCVQFTDQLALVDVDTRTVTFETESWIGVVCPNALLAEASGAPLTLADFNPADLVSVRGYPVTEETLKICQMIRQ